MCGKVGFETVGLGCIAGLGAVACFHESPMVSGLGAIAHAGAVSRLMLQDYGRVGRVLSIGTTAVLVSALSPRGVASFGIMAGSYQAWRAWRGESSRSLILRGISSVAVWKSIEDRLALANLLFARFARAADIRITRSEAGALALGIVAAFNSSPVIGVLGIGVSTAVFINEATRSYLSDGWRTTLVAGLSGLGAMVLGPSAALVGLAAAAAEKVGSHYFRRMEKVMPA